MEKAQKARGIPFDDIFHVFDVRSMEVYQVVAISSFVKDKEFRCQRVLSRF
jgi:hypothetical protein